jgi:hypothetical protein
VDKLIIYEPRSLEFHADHVAVVCEVGKASDGYHSYDDLYAHRHELFIALMRLHPEISFRTWRNQDGEQWHGWFIAGMNLPSGQISYHLPASYWDRLEGLPTHYCNAGYDGHTSADVAYRLAAYSSSLPSGPPLNARPKSSRAHAD